MRKQFEELHPLFDLEKDEQGEYTCVLTRVTWLGFELGKKTLLAEIDQLNAELALCREENKGLVGKVSEQQKRVGFAFTEFEMFAGYLCEHQPQGGDFITETLLMHGRVLKALRGGS